MASEISECNEIMLTEIITNDFFLELEPAEIIGILAIFIEEKSNKVTQISSLNVTPKIKETLEHINYIAQDFGDYEYNSRIEVDTDSGSSELVLEYVADEARSTNPVIHVYAEEALRSYMYYKLCERKSTVPANEKARARREYYNDRRLAKARLSNFTKEEALKTIRKNFILAPKY